MALHDIFKDLVPSFMGEELFDYLPNVVFFVKNAQGEYVHVNKTLVQRCNLTAKSDLIGRTPMEVIDLCPKEFGEPAKHGIALRYRWHVTLPTRP